MRQEFTTDKGSFLIVKVPYTCKLAHIKENSSGEYVQYMFQNQDNKTRLNTTDYLPPGNWEIVGKAFDLTEEQCANLLPKPLTRARDNQLGFMWYPTDNEIYRNAKDCFNAFLSELSIYQTNPCKDGEPSIVNHDVWYSHQEWVADEERTGSFILLKKI
jgi:hypothetical protein